MRAFGLVLCCAVLVGCLPVGCLPAPPCSSDTDCKGDRICEAGECVDPDGDSDGGDWSEPDGGYSDDGGGLSCGEEVIPCICPTGGIPPYEGFTEPSTECNTGFVGYFTCGVCQFSYAWYAVCVC